MSYCARRVPADLKGSGWYEILPPPGPAVELDSDVNADWAIVGAGFAGLSAAHRLTQLCPGARIVLVDAQRVGWGAAGRNSGFMIDLPHELRSQSYAGADSEDLRQIRMNRAGIEFAKSIAAEYGLFEYFNPCGKYHGAANGAGVKSLRTFEAHLEKLGEQFTRLDAADMKQITGSGYYSSGTFTPGAVIIQPAGYVRRFAQSLKHKITLFENSPVTRIDKGQVHILHCPKGKIMAPNLILTVNGHIESFGLFERRLMHVFTFASMTRQLAIHEAERIGGRSEWALVPAHPMGTTVRRTRDRRIVVRNSFTYNSDMQTSTRQIERLSSRHDRSLAARFPSLKGIEMPYRWGGHLAMTLNSVPAFGEVDERIYAACGDNGLGTVKSTLGGKLIAELATGTEGPMLRDMLGLDKPQKLYPEPLMTLAAQSYLAWTQYRAGTDL